MVSEGSEPVVIRLSVPGLPAWAVELVAASPTTYRLIGSSSVEGRLCSGRNFSRLEVSIDGVREMDILTFQQAVADAYRWIFERLPTLVTRHPVRFWAFVPYIHEDMGAELDRYLVFNAGRFAAYSAWCGGREAFGRAIATGSAVGVKGNRLALHCLASAVPGRPIENPRQLPAYRYSRRYGPLPPCFARATSVRVSPGGAHLLVGGTASIRGEDSLHVGDIEAQILETLRNLSRLAQAASGGPSDGDGAAPDLSWLERFRELRIYRPHVEHTERILAMLLPYFPRVERIELLEAELCRPELLVELEGVVDIEASGQSRG